MIVWNFLPKTNSVISKINKCQKKWLFVYSEEQKSAVIYSILNTNRIYEI